MKKIVAALAVLAFAAPALVLAEDGAEVFKAKCASCHGPDGKGETTMGKKLGVKNLVGTKADVVQVVNEGKPPKMMAYKGKLTDDQIKAVAGFVKTLK
jgi:cytochrome c6